MKNRLAYRVSFIICIYLITSGYVFSQQTMAIGDSNPKSNAILYLKGNGTQGLIIPIVSSLGNFGESGMVVYNSADKKVYYHDGTNWSAIGGTTSDGLIGNEVSQVGTNGGLVLSGNGTTASPLTISLVSGTSDGQTLRWNNATSKWEVTSASTGLSTTLNSAQIYVGNAANTATAVTLSGDATLSNTGAVTIANNAVNSAKIADGSIANADISTSAAIAPSKLGQAAAISGDVLKWNGTAWAPAADAGGLSTTLTSGQVIVGNASNVATGVAVSGDATMSNTGVLTIANSAVNSNKIADGSIVNADISTSAAIAPSKIAQSAAVNGDVLKWNGTSWAPAADNGLSSTLTSGNVLVGNASNVATGVSISGDATMTNAGVLTIGTGAVTSAKIADGTIASADILDGTVASADIADNSITNADVNASAAIAGTKIAPAFGTQQITTSGGINASGAITFGNLAGTGARVVYADPSGNLGTQTAWSTANYVPKGNGTTLTESQIYDNGVSVGVGNTSPVYKLDVHSSSDTQLHAYNPTDAEGAKSGIRFGAGSYWAVQLQTALGTDWLQLTNNSGTPYHRWTFDSYYPGFGSSGYIQGLGSGLALQGGNVGVGMTNPTHPLHVNGNIGLTGYIYFTGGTNPVWLFNVPNAYSGIHDHWIPNNSNLFDLGTTTWRWRTLYTNTNPNVSSDLRLKNNIRTLEYGLDEILRMRPVSYSYKTDKNKKIMLGLIAQEVRTIIPEIVTEDTSPDKILGITYSDLIPVLINAVQEQQKIIDEQKAQLEKMGKDLAEVKKTTGAAELENLKAEIAEIKRLLGTEASVEKK